ncbi:glycosyltransferase family 39 protein [Acidipila rosea]|uniref:4-amino-4-deoxy-L-arabinose transferase-like glycosyltransferase n=1 Tax=Acidipila rosea TaxID=768535 RepID=A0A4R1L3A7_9BACT|nr:glycosyltransferase family 39 protein [Acidipila rosea]TCK72516.1 4-amino-4-deoxy-L-arabinose transferase-like glycosyltransferase [Acidipila rosea]
MKSYLTAKRFVLPLLGLWLLLYGSFTLFTPPLADGLDALRAEAARGMMLRHQWITPYADGVRYLADAPAPTWAMAASFRIFGISDWAARLPLAFTALLLVLVAFRMAIDLTLNGPADRARRSGFYAALILVTNVALFAGTREMNGTVLTALAASFAAHFFWRSLRLGPTLGSAIGFAAACALALLSAGLPGLLVPLITVALVLVRSRRLSHLQRWHPFAALAVFLLLALPWHIAASLANRGPGPAHGFLWHYFVAHQGRELFLFMRHHATAATGMLSYFLIFLAAFLPWVIFHSAQCPECPEEEHAKRRLLSCWLLTAVLLGLLFPQQVGVVALAPPLAMMAADWLAADEESPAAAGVKRAQLLFRVGVLIALGCAVLLRYQPHVAGLSHRAVAWLHVPPGIIATAVLVGTGANLLLRRRGRARLANCFLAGMMVFVLLGTQAALVTVSAVNSSQNLAQAISPELNADSVIVINGRLEQASSFAFYLGRRVLVVNGRGGELAYGASFNDLPPVFLDQAALAKLWNGPGRVFLWTEEQFAPAFAAPVYVIARSGGKMVLSNAPNEGGADF